MCNTKIKVQCTRYFKKLKNKFKMTARQKRICLTTASLVIILVSIQLVGRVLGASSNPVSGKRSRKNVVLILTDDQGKIIQIIKNTAFWKDTFKGLLWSRYKKMVKVRKFGSPDFDRICNQNLFWIYFDFPNEF